MMTMNIVTLLLLLLGYCCSMTAATDGETGAASNGTASCGRKIILAVCLDGSGSMSVADFNKQQQLVILILARLNLSTGDITFGIASFGTGFYPVGKFTKDPAVANEMVNQTSYRGSTTETGKCMDWARQSFEKEGDPNGICVLYLSTDGGSTNHTHTIQAAKALRDKGCIVISLGIGPKINRPELIEISTNNTYMEVSNFSLVFQTLDQTVNKICTGQPEPSCPSNASFDVVHCVDSSGSINKTLYYNNVVLLLGFLKSVVIGPENVRMGVAVYGTHNYPQTNGLRANRTELIVAVNGIPYRGSTTSTHLCIQWAISVLLAARINRPQLINVITDGNPTDVAATNKSVDDAKAAGIIVKMVAVGNEPNIALMKAMDSDNEVIQANSYSDLPRFIFSLAKKTCDAAQRPPKTSTTSPPTSSKA